MQYTTSSRIENVTLWTGVITITCISECFQTKEMCGIDSRKNQRWPKPVYIKGEAVERLATYKYLGVVFDSNLNWKENINSGAEKKWTRECIAW